MENSPRFLTGGRWRYYSQRWGRRWYQALQWYLQGCFSSLQDLKDRVWWKALRLWSPGHLHSPLSSAGGAGIGLCCSI